MDKEQKPSNEQTHNILMGYHGALKDQFKTVFVRVFAVLAALAAMYIAVVVFGLMIVLTIIAVQ